MRFTRYYKCEYNDTAMKRAALVRNQAKAVAALPLFSEEVKANLPDVEDVMAKRAKAYSHDLKRDRKRTADKWLCARYLLRKMPPEHAKRLKDYWQDCQWPGTPTYFLTMLDMFNNGNLPGFEK